MFSIVCLQWTFVYREYKSTKMSMYSWATVYTLVFDLTEKTQRPRQRWKNRRRIIRLKCSVCSVWPVRVYFRFRVAHDSRAIKFYTLIGLRYETENHGAWNEEKGSLGWRILERVKKRLLEQRNLVRSMLRSVSFVLLIKEHVYVCITTEYTTIRYVS